MSREYGLAKVRSGVVISAAFGAVGSHVRGKTLPNDDAGDPIPDRSLLPLLPSVQILFDFFCLDRGWSSQRGLPVNQDLRTRFEQRSFFAIEL